MLGTSGHRSSTPMVVYDFILAFGGDLRSSRNFYSQQTVSDDEKEQERRCKVFREPFTLCNAAKTTVRRDLSR